jgi:hypothetical protein
LFFFLGTNKLLKGQLLNRIGGNDIFDPHEHTFCLECQIPIEAIHINAMKINFILVSQNISINLTICRLYQSFVNSKIYLKNESKFLKMRSNNNEIGACTQTSNHDLEFPLWINYHYKMGIKHFYIYDNSLSNQTSLHKTLKDYIDLNIITIIPWHFDQWNGFKYYSSNWINHQVWSQNDCIHRYGYLHSWILISDVDEFILPMGKFSNFLDLLNTIPSNYCALQILHYSFRDLIKNKIIPEEDRPSMF